MPECDRCGEVESLPHNCNYCGRTLCSKHILPENHNCAGLERTKTLGPEFRSEESNSIFDVAGSINILGGSEDASDAQPRERTTSSTEPDYESSPDVERDGSIAGHPSDNPRNKSSLLRWPRKMVMGVGIGSRYRGDCPNCGKWVSMRRSERFTRCHRCGWKPGLPILRIVTHWPNWYLWKRRAIRWTKLAVLLVGIVGILALVIGATTGTGIPAIDNTATDIAEAVGVGGWANSTADETPTASGSSGGAGQQQQQHPPPSDRANEPEPITPAQIEQRIHYFVNQERTERNLGALSYDDRLADIARSHSRDMTSNGYFAHESPDGESMEDRYSAAGYECWVPISDNRYAVGAENIAYTYAYATVRTDSGQLVNHGGNESEIARGIVRQWMNSPDHRENILQPHWRSEGIGVAIAQVDGDVRVYATQNFC